MKRTKLLVALLVVLLSFLVTTNLWAAAEFHPYLTVEEEYNDNIYLDDSLEQEDWITTIQPGLSLTYTNRSIDATVDYSLRYRFYNDNDDENTDSFSEAQRADASALFFSGRPFTLLITEGISSEALDSRDHGADYNELVNRSIVYRTSVAPEYRLQLIPTFSVVFGYIYDRADYVDSRGIDWDEHNGHISLVKQLAAGSELFARGAYIIHQSDDVADEFDRINYTLGLTQQVSGRITGTVEGGYTQIEYDSGYDTDNWIWSVDVTYHYSEPVTLSIGYSQDFESTAFEGLTKFREFSLAANYQKDSTTASVELFGNYSKYVREDRDDKAAGIRADWSHPLGSALSTHLDTEYEHAKYTDSGPDEDVDRFTVGVSLDYTYRRFLASLGYHFRFSDSDVDANDYTNNVVTLSGTVRF